MSVLSPDNTDSIISIDGTSKVHLRFTSVEGGSDTAEIVAVQVQVYSVGEWVTRGSFQVSTRPFTFDPSSANAYEEFDISEYLDPGDNQVRIQATGMETGVTGRLIFNSLISRTTTFRLTLLVVVLPSHIKCMARLTRLCTSLFPVPNKRWSFRTIWGLRNIRLITSPGRLLNRPVMEFLVTACIR